jgi:hypothetical protein
LRPLLVSFAEMKNAVLICPEKKTRTQKSRRT